MSVMAVIREEILQSPKGRIPFDRFMELALYHPNDGYYAAGKVEIGSKGDFFTSSSLGADFGELLAVQFIEMSEILGESRPFTLVEVGAGSGVLAKDILDRARRQSRDFYERLTYVIVERSLGLKAKQQETLREYLDKNDKVCWRDWETLDSIEGCVFSNELIDAFPVHRISIESGELREVYVTLGEPFREVSDELSRPEIRDYFELVGVKIPSALYPEGYRTEVNLAALQWLEQVGAKLDRGYVVTLDYGYPAGKYYHPQRYRGTLQCYYRHRHHDNPYLYVGQQDITAHVDFTALERQGEKVGLTKLGFVPQGLFLMALGLGERLVELSRGEVDAMTLFQRRSALHQLIDPTGLGGFGVLIQGKGVPERGLRGLQTGADRADG